MNSLRVEKKDIYRIEVNDDGEYIEFNLNDIGNSMRFYEALDKIDKIQKKYADKLKEFTESLKENPELESENLKDFVYTENGMFQEMRDAMDIALGEGACQKIFGDANYYEMYNDLIEEFSKPREELGGKSHFDMIEFKVEDVHKRIIEKYKKGKKVSI